MSDIAIKVENISKKYEIGENKKYPTLRDKLVELPTRLFKGPRKTKEFWALKDVSFEVKKGEVVGIIGRNGAGKSTMLKILARITEPTSGKITMYGRVASMLEVGTGFNPELTGRENIYLNGAIIGMTRQEIVAKFDDIVEFSGVGKFLDTPVKHYSSGMYVRLAFAVAAHLDADILLVDEVLAVGDAEFQKKCLGKMSDLAGSGKTVIFVSHDIGSINNLCTQVILFESGKVHAKGISTEIIDKYYNDSTSKLGVLDLSTSSNSELIEIKSLTISDLESKKVGIIDFQHGLLVKLNINVRENFSAVIGFSISDQTGQIITSIHSKELGINNDNNGDFKDPLILKETKSIIIEVSDFISRPGKYDLLCTIFSRSQSKNIYSTKPIAFLIGEKGDDRLFDHRQPGKVFPKKVKWEFK